MKNGKVKGLMKKILIPIAIAGTLFTTSPTYSQEKEKNFNPPVFSQENFNSTSAQVKKDSNPKFSASTSFGFFRANDKKIREVYEGGFPLIQKHPHGDLSPILKASFDYNISRHLRLEGDFFSCIGNSGKPYINDTKNTTQLEGIFLSTEIPSPKDIEVVSKWSSMSVGQLTGIAEYLIPISKKDFTPNFYIGAGLTSPIYYEEIYMGFKEINSNKFKIAKKEGYKSSIGLTGVLGFELPLGKIDDYSLLSYIQLSGSYANVKGDLGKVNVGGLSFEAGIKFGFNK